MIKKLTIGTRASKLALWQAHHVQSLIQTKFKIEVNIKKISTKGDQIQDRSLMEIGGKGLFLKEIEDELLAGTVDIAVHSMKDVPYDLPKGLTLCTILKREDPTDAFVSNAYQKIEDMPEGARIGTSSLRRMLQLKHRFPHLVFKDLRGNVDTRLKKLDANEFDAIILASAGLKRLGLSDRITQRLDIVSAVGQGAVGIECKTDQTELMTLLQTLSDDITFKAVTIERHYSRLLEGTCQTPLGCHVEAANNKNEFNLRCFKAEISDAKINIHQISGDWQAGQSLVQELVAKHHS